jgi:hypothetical protein
MVPDLDLSGSESSHSFVPDDSTGTIAWRCGSVTIWSSLIEAETTRPSTTPARYGSATLSRRGVSMSMSYALTGSTSYLARWAELQPQCFAAR